MAGGWDQRWMQSRRLGPALDAEQEAGTRVAKFREYSKLETFHGNLREFTGINGN